MSSRLVFPTPQPGASRDVREHQRLYDVQDCLHNLYGVRLGCGPEDLHLRNASLEKPGPDPSDSSSEAELADRLLPYANALPSTLGCGDVVRREHCLARIVGSSADEESP